MHAMSNPRGVTELIEDPATLTDTNSLAAAYVASLRERGTPALVTNAASDVMLLRNGSLHLPVTVDDGTVGRTYVTSAHSAYVLYARDEIALLGLGQKQRAANAVIGTLDLLLRGIAINRAVHIDNWLLSTNLHGTWQGEGLGAMRELLAQRFPGHFLVIRSLDAWTCPALLDAAKADGWTLLPARQVWVTDDLQTAWHPRNQTRNDARALKRSGLHAEQPTALSESDCARIADLYHQLYVGRYSAINPIFSPRFIGLSLELGLLRYCVVRNDDGVIMAFAALRSAGGIGTVPLMGYDMVCPQDMGLYRIASYLAADLAMTSRLRFHGSSGASEFKRNRGAHGVIEYMAVDGRHLSPARRAGLALLAAGLNRFMTPMLERNGW